MINNQSDAAKQMVFDFKIKPYVDSNGWIRILIKENNNIKLQFSGLLTQDDFKDRLKFRDFGVSDNEHTMNTSQSWYIQNVKLQAKIANNIPGYPAVYLNPNIVNLNKVIANCFNGKTPTGTLWSQAYNQGYLIFSGIINTYGIWDKFWMGQTQNPYVKIRTPLSLRSGGGVHHTGQFIHSAYNVYKDIDHSITSRWDWNNKRVFWIRI